MDAVFIYHFFYMFCSCPNCKASYNLKDDLLGKQLECPNCKNVFVAEPLTQEVVPVGDTSIVQVEKEQNMTTQGIFGKHKYGIKQKKIAINEKYFIKDENNNDLFFSVRRLYFWRRFGAMLLGFTLLILFIILGSALGSAISNDGLVIGIITTLFGLLGLAALIVIMSIAGRRGIEFYMSEADMDKNDSEFTITQDNLFEFIKQHYTLRQNGEIIAQFEKNIFTDILRKKWHISYNGKHILVKEESVILGILRRLGVPFIRTNFIFIDITSNPKSDVIIGYFKRKFEIFDNYLLDMTNDPAFTVPREVAICMSVLLDCGERR